ncbi:sensor histidine kinase [Saccharothrix yanglingensis]|uniref:histidine kinase n=1 Tax=Saccharothrix yanglingensis TaxID=659496 RepID=A0ABU0X3S7_9PSEU|nr:HAMP domain-containing sensor histidine kinase [Saccharothrix yanglingensis]MDQ2586786.1 two-component sensor histidine kinase [Saccharothrix yanglingensis]
MGRRPGPSVRLKLTLSYAGFLMLAGALLLAAVWLFLLRGGPGSSFVPTFDDLRLLLTPGNFGPRIFGPAATAVLAFLLVFGLVGGWLLAGHMLAPLTRIADAARKAGNGSLSHRVRLPGRGDEFRELADAFDTMLARLEAHVGEQRRFAANASHELRTPLAISQALLDVARDDPEGDRPELVERLRAVNARAIDLTEALLLLSRSDRGSFTREPVDLSLAAEEAAEALLPLAERRGVVLDVTGGPAPTVGSGALLLRMVANLVQNAVVHNLPAGGTATVHTESRHDASVLRVESTGPPLPPELVPTLTEPFQRGAERARADGHVGAGLGLAIVRSIVRAHDGTLDLAPRPGGGLLVTVRLPGARRAGRDGGPAAGWAEQVAVDGRAGAPTSWAAAQDASRRSAPSDGEPGSAA